MTLATRTLRLHLLSVLGAPLAGAKVSLRLSAYQADENDIVPLNWVLPEDPIKPGDYVAPVWPNTRNDGGTHYEMLVQASGQQLLTGILTVPVGAGESVHSAKINPPPYPPVYGAEKAVGDANTFADASGESASRALAAVGTIEQVSEDYGTVSAAAALASEKADVAVGASGVAAQAAIDAQTFRDGALAAGRFRLTREIAHADASIPVGEGFVSPVGPGDTLQAYRKDSNTASTAIGAPFPSSARMSSMEEKVRGADPVKGPALFAVADPSGNAPLMVDGDGKTHVGAIDAKTYGLGDSSLGSLNNGAWEFVIHDGLGNVAFGVRPDGSVYPAAPSPTAGTAWSELVIGADDSIVHIGDSYTASHYVLKDKAYISQLAALSPYRHINYGVSGDDLLDMQYRIVQQSPYVGTKFGSMKARYAFITSLTNDGPFRGADLTFYAENTRRLVETVRAEGTEPVITTEFPALAAEHAMLRRVADEMGCAFVDCTSYDVEVGGLDLGPFHQGHPGTRTGGVFWLPMLDFIDRMPRPTRAIKIYRRRSTFAVASIADLLYKDRIDRSKRWKELTLAHNSLNPPGKFEELDQLGTWPTDFNYIQHEDEYLRLAAGSAVPVADYALLELTLPGNASALEAVELTLGSSAAPTVYVRDYLDVAASMPGKRQGMSPTDATYLSKWDKPRGAWRSLGAYGGPITIPATELRNSMQGNTLVMMLAGAFNLSNLRVRYKGREVRSDLRLKTWAPPIGPELLTLTLCGTSSQLAPWTKTGSPTILVPIDVSNAPRKPGAVDVPVDGVAIISAGDTIGQTVALPAQTGALRRFRLTVWARYFPKAFLNPALYPGLDAAQIIDRIANPAAAPITPETNDLRTLKCEAWFGGAYPAQGGAEFFDFAALQWRPIEFTLDALAFRSGTALSFRLSCPDGEIQVGKASLKEIA